MNINELTIGQIKEIQQMMGNQSAQSAYRDQVGKQVLIRTVTMVYTGRIKQEFTNELVLESACWIADTGRWADNLKSCEFEDVEPYVNDVIVAKGGILDVTEIATLPTEQK